MKRHLTTLVAICSFSLCLMAQSTFKELKPSKISKIELSAKGEAEYNKWIKLIAKKDPNPDELAFIGKYIDIFNEVQDSYWGTPPSAGCSWYCGDAFKDVKASSSLAQQGSTTYSADNAHDFSYKTAWSEGVSGYGEGEYLLYTFAGTPRVTDVIIANGHVKSASAWKNNSRVKRMRMYYNGNPYAILNLEDSRSEQTFTLGDTLGLCCDNAKDWTLKFEILEVYPGDKYDDTVIAELYFDGVGVHCFTKGTRVKMADGTEKTIENIKAGDSVLSYASGTIKEYTVASTASVLHVNLVTYTFASGNTIVATQDHPILLSDNTWASFAPEKSSVYAGFDSIKKIAVGCQVMTANGTDTLTNIEVNPAEQMTYTITNLNGATSFFANGIVVGVETLK